MREKDITKKEIADFCESVYLDKSLKPKQITDRIGAMIKRHLKDDSIGISAKRVRVGQHSEVHYSFTNISDKLVGEDRKKAEVTEAHRISNKLREWKDAITALNLPHHLIEKNLDKAAKKLIKVFGREVKRVSTTLGPEQEYFLIDRKLYEERPDLVCNRGRIVDRHLYFLFCLSGFFERKYRRIRKSGSHLFKGGKLRRSFKRKQNAGG